MQSEALRRRTLREGHHRDKRDAQRRGVAGRSTSLPRTGRILAPIDHVDSTSSFLTGTGLTHLGSADARDRMHAKAHAEHSPTREERSFRMSERRSLGGGMVEGRGSCGRAPPRRSLERAQPACVLSSRSETEAPGAPGLCAC